MELMLQVYLHRSLYIALERATEPDDRNADW
jgi:hypothetical protein